MNNDSFFYQDDGKTVGPVTMTDLRGRIKEGKVRLFDLILKEGEPSWRMALEHGEFKEDFKEKSKGALRERPWVCLQRKSPDGFDFLTTGPFSEEEVRENLMAGKVSYTDYVWRNGFPEWKRIGLLEDFNPRLKKMNFEAPPPEEEDAEELVKNVVELKRPKPVLPELPPPEAETDDLTKSPLPPPIPEVKKAPIEMPEHSRLTAGPRAISRISTISTIKIPDKQKRRRKNVPWLDWGIVGILVVVLGAVAMVLSRNIKRARTLDVPASTVVETVPPLPNTPLGYETAEEDENRPEPADDEPKELEPEEPEEPAPKAQAKEPPKKIPPRAPTELVLNVQNRSQNQIRFDLRTNGTKEFPVYLQVVGVPGHVTTGASFYRYLRLRTSGDLQKPLDLSKVKLPQGRLIVRASSGDLKKETKVNVGVNDPQYKQAIGRVRKLHAYAIWSERLRLINLSALLATRIGQAVSGQKFSGKGLEAVNQVRLVNGYKYALFDDWFELKNIMTEAQRSPSAALAAKAKRINDKMVAYTVWK
jgi:hypothetical protein